MKLRLFATAASTLLGATSALLVATAGAQQPAGVDQALGEIASQPATHSAVTFDRDMMQSLLGGWPVAALNGITVESYRYRQPAFYIPEEIHSLVAAYDAAGWKHLVNANATPGQSAEPAKPITDMWLHPRAQTSTAARC